MKIHYICPENPAIPKEMKGKVRKILNVFRCFLGYFFFIFVIQTDNKDKVLEMVKSIKDFGNALFKEQKFQPAKKKYKKALR